MARRRPPLKYRAFVALRRTSQAAFLALFVWAALRTRLDMGVFTVEPQLDANVRWWFFFDPLILLSSFLAQKNLLESLLLLSLATVAVTALFGRFFCGWVCPFGTLHHAAGWLGRRVFREKWQRPIREKFHAAQRVKVWVLAGLLVAALLGVNMAGLLDPLSFLQRSLTVFVLPLTERILMGAAAALRAVEPLEGAGRALEGWTLDHLFGFEAFTFRQSALIGGLFVGLLAANIFVRRFWCRFCCPLGALLGILGKFSLLRIQPGEGCSSCQVCSADCEGGAEPHRPMGPRMNECLMVGNCLVQCTRNELHLKFERPGGALSSPEATDPGRRRLLGAALTGMVAAPLMRMGLRPERPHPALIRPPGALPEPEFLEACVRCDACLKACPTNFLQPALLEGRLEGLWTPVGDAAFGFCEFECALCGHACPTAAIAPLTLAEKKETKIATAFVDRSRCIPWIFDRECSVCEEHCPTTPKAITFHQGGGGQGEGGGGRGRGRGRLMEEGEAGASEGERIKRPIVDPDLCIGCGICQNKCPVMDLAAIRISAVGESRAGLNPFAPKEATDQDSVYENPYDS